ncbi:MAG TPA: AAA family ATPase, partial [Candidatus Limnocylindrales bacterium]|nr:AAA family ATPase [Candidatus Limnocylindrales bacterium]
MPARSPRPATKPPATAMRAFLFSDLRGYTAFVESHGDAAAAGLLKEYRGLVRREVAKHKGAEVKTEGDSFYVVFTSPSAALDCAVAILRKVEARNAKEPGHPLRVGLGLHAGETVEFDDQFVGSAVNVAARLTAKAEAGELIVSDTCRGLVRTATSHAMTEQGALRLKGVSERIRAWKVEWREDVPPAAPEAPAQPSALLSPSAPAGPAGPAPGQLVSPVMIGREAEAARLVEMLALAAGGRGQTVLLAGEAGVGKSAIVRAAQEAASARGFRLLYGATMESDGGLPYAPFVAAVRSGFRGLDRDRLGRVLAQTAPDLAQLFPELGRDAREPSSAEQLRLSVAFHGLFTAFAREAPVLLVVEDLHWADEA